MVHHIYKVNYLCSLCIIVVLSTIASNEIEFCQFITHGYDVVKCPGGQPGTNNSYHIGTYMYLSIFRKVSLHFF